MPRRDARALHDAVCFLCTTKTVAPSRIGAGRPANAGSGLRLVSRGHFTSRLLRRPPRRAPSDDDRG